MIRLLLSSLRFYWRSHLGVLLGVMLASAVLTGSLLVGDSVDGSLRMFALQRLGNIQYALHMPNRFFASSLAERISGDTAAVLHLRGMAMVEDRQINQVNVLGCGSRFWQLGGAGVRLKENEVALNQKLAAALNVNVGDEVSLRIEKPGVMPRSAPLASQKGNQTVRGRFTVGRILEDNELGRFSLSANQVVPYNAFVNSAWLGEKTERLNKANLLVSGCSNPGLKLESIWTPADFGLRFRKVGSVVQLESDGIYFDPETARAALALQGAQGSLTYLVNSISKDQKATPYSFIVAHEQAGLEDHQIILNEWLANELSADVGDVVSVKYFELLSSSRFEERDRKFTVKQVMKMAKLEQERELAPQFPGLTDVDRCSDWDVGIPMEEEQLDDKRNEAYWNQYRQTPKAIVSLPAGQEMWSNRFGSLTAARWINEGNVEADFRKEFNPAAAGFVFQPVRKQALAAVDHALDFGQLFLGMSFFLIVAALMLTGLLFVFGVQQRAEEMGILLSTGWQSNTVRNLVWAEGAGLAVAGSLLGAWLGTGYTRALIFGLSRYWQGAVANSAIQYCAELRTVLVGALASFVCAITAMGIAVWRQAKHPARELLMADFTQPPAPVIRHSTGVGMYSVFACGLGAIAIVLHTLMADVRSVAMPFFSTGALLLIAGVILCGVLLRRMDRPKDLIQLNGIAFKNMARRRGRSLTVIGLLASGSFLVFSVSSMKEDITAHVDEPWSGSGGFSWFGESTLPISEDLGGVRLRVRDGDDASCLNLNRAQSPRLLGVNPEAMSDSRAFIVDEDIWALLNVDLADNLVPALVGDSDTAAWGLEAKTGVENGDVLEYRDESGNRFKVKLVGKLPMRLSVFQGSLLIAEEDFVEQFPSEEGWRMFLLNEPVEGRRYGRGGLNVLPSAERLMEYYAVESTYLTMFLVLGALGLIVGSMGMGVIVLRNVQDRRPELALLQAVGFRKQAVQKALLLEHGFLLCMGLGVGVIAAAVAMLPVILSATATVPYTLLITLLAAILGCGSICILIAMSIALRGDVLKALRNE